LEPARRSGIKPFYGHDHGEGLDLAGNAAAGHFGGELGDFPEAVQDLFAALFLPALSVWFLLDELLLQGGPVLEHVGANTGLALV